MRLVYKLIMSKIGACKRHSDQDRASPIGREEREGTQQGQQAGRQSSSGVSMMLIIVMVAEPSWLFGDDRTQRNK